MIPCGSPLRALVCASLLGLPSIGCQASVRGDVKASGQVREPDPFARLNDPEPSGAADAPELRELDGQLQSSPTQMALLGARHDLQLQPRTAPSCSCMAFAVGRPTDSRFAWEDGAPVLSGADSAVVAFGMVDGECASEVKASYRGYEVVGADVHILLEPAVEGRPRLAGAIVPLPQPGGRYVIVPPTDAPFGKSRTAGETRCTLSEPTDGSSARRDAAAGTSARSPERESASVVADEPEDVPTSEEFDATPSEIPLDDGERSLRDGFHFGLILGLEYPIARIDVGSGLDPGMVSGLGGGFDLFIGGNQKPGMAVGLTIGGASAPNPAFDYAPSQSPQAENLAGTSGWEVDGGSLVLNGVRLNLFRIGAFVDYYFSEESNWHGLLTLGYASMSFSGTSISDASQGFALQAGVGYDFWLSYHWSLGVLGRLLWSPMSVESLNEVVHVFSPNLGVSATFH